MADNQQMSKKAENIRKRILENCFLDTNNDSEDFLSTIISNISKVITEEIEELEKRLSRKQNREFKKRVSPYDASGPRNLSRGPG